MSRISLLISLMFLSLVSCQTTEYNSYNYTVTYNPIECQSDADCNEGLTGVCATDNDGQTIECKYCESNGLYNVCKPGTAYY